MFTALIAFAASMVTNAQLEPGDKAVDFKLPNVDGKMVALSDYAEEKGVILIFTCNPCPFSKAYEQRIIKMHNRFSTIGYPVVAINPNDISLSPDDTMEKMKERASEKEYPFVYLKDNSEVFKAYGATRTPHVFLLKNNGSGDYTVAFIGAIDNNAMDEKAVSEKYVEQAIISLEQGVKVDPEEVKAVGCTIKTRG
ncbi:MAG: thioredoxin family protein [Bacteroidales bacterium]|nr:thioredoxin family protein [Bacteroidales bacterium]